MNPGQWFHKPPRARKEGQKGPLEPDFTATKDPDRGPGPSRRIFAMAFDRFGQSRGVRGFQHVQPDFPRAGRLHPDDQLFALSSIAR